MGRCNLANPCGSSRFSLGASFGRQQLGLAAAQPPPPRIGKGSRLGDRGVGCNGALENYWQVYGAVYLEGSVNVDLEPVTRYGFSKVARRQA